MSRPSEGPGSSEAMSRTAHAWGWVLEQPASEAMLSLEQRPEPPEQALASHVHLRLLAAAPGPWDLHNVEASPPRIPGGVFAGLDDNGQMHLVGGFLPCGQCPMCQAALHLHCEAPMRPGLDAPGGFAEHLALPAAFVAPLPRPIEDSLLRKTLALLAGAGPAYQAMALAGACPGDSVVLCGGHAAIVEIHLHLLIAMGLHPQVLVDPASPLPVGSFLPDVPRIERAEDLSGLTSSRLHLLAQSPQAPLLDALRPLTTRALSLSILGPAPLPPEIALARFLLGPTALRRIRDLHPHLVLDLVGLARFCPSLNPGWFPPHEFPVAFAAFRTRPEAPLPLLRCASPSVI